MLRLLVIAIAWLGVAHAVPAAADFYVDELPDLTPGSRFPTMHAGLLNVTGGKLFFWHVSANYQRTDSRKRMLWLNGGPGCSSMDGALLELGPFGFNAEGGLVENEGSWTENIDLLFLDQPLGTGYSVSDGALDGSLEIAAEKVAEFFEEYFKVFPEQQRDHWYLAGESFAGQYLPHVWKVVRNIMQVKGVFIGGPWIDPPHQYLSYANFLKQKNLVAKENWPKLDELQKACIDALQETKELVVSACEDISSFALRMYGGSKQCFNVYDYDKISPYDLCGMEWPETLPLMKKYLSRPEVRKALHVPVSSETWEECKGSVHRAMKANNDETGIKLLPEMLEETPVLLATGEKDYICNYDGVELALDNLKWGNSTTFGFHDDEQPEILSLEGRTIGVLKQARGLSFLNVANGTHMLPIGLPTEMRLVAEYFVQKALDKEEILPIKDPSGNTEEVAAAVRRAYRRASLLALIVVGIVAIVIFVACWRSSNGFSLLAMARGFMHSSLKRPKFTSNRYVRLSDLRRPEVIIEEEDEEN